MALFDKDGETRFDGGSQMLTIIGPEAYFHGVLTVRGSLRIQGEVEGDIHEANEITVGSNGRVKGDVCAELVTVSGTIEGSVVAAKQLEIKEGGKVHGNIRTSKLLIEEGAVFEGNCVMGGTEEGAGSGAGAPSPSDEDEGVKESSRSSVDSKIVSDKEKRRTEPVHS